MNYGLEELGINTIEEAAELIKAIGKAQRFGLESRNPLLPDSPTNRDQIEEEAADVIACIELMQDNDIISKERVQAMVPAKKAKKIGMMAVSRAMKHPGATQDSLAFKDAWSKANAELEVA